IQVDVPVVAVGEPKGFEKDGTLEIVHKELKVSSLPLDLPDFIEVDVTGLDIGDCIRVEEIRVREGVEILYDTNFTVVTIVPPSAEKVGMKPEEAEISIEEVGAEKEATDTDKE
nr:50S ribosomal protein L25 [Desulfobacterales bacterium]